MPTFNYNRFIEAIQKKDRIRGVTNYAFNDFLYRYNVAHWLGKNRPFIARPVREQLARDYGLNLDDYMSVTHGCVKISHDSPSFYD